MSCGLDEIGRRESMKIVCVDFDGVLHSYCSGWKGVAAIPDPPIAGSLEWLLSLVVADDIKPVIYSSRSKSWRGRSAMRRWLRDNYATLWLRELDRAVTGGHTSVWRMAITFHGTGMDEPHVEADYWAGRLVKALEFPSKKPPAYLTVDDRAWCFRGTFPSVEEVREFQAWGVG